MKKLLLISLIISAPVSATGSACIVCPPGYDCSTGRPVANTGNARLATIGDIPTTATQVGAVPTTRKIGGIDLSSDITLLQVEQLVREAQEAKREADDCDANRNAFISHSICSLSSSSPDSMAAGYFCWCRKQGTNHRCNIHSAQDFSPWTFIIDYSDTQSSTAVADCQSRCAGACAGGSSSSW